MGLSTSILIHSVGARAKRRSRSGEDTYLMLHSSHTEGRYHWSLARRGTVNATSSSGEMSLSCHPTQPRDGRDVYPRKGNTLYPRAFSGVLYLTTPKGSSGDGRITTCRRNGEVFRCGFLSTQRIFINSILDAETLSCSWLVTIIILSMLGLGGGGGVF